jgi:hypothetical protein
VAHNAAHNVFLTLPAYASSRELKATGWRCITPVSIRRARGNAISLDAIARFLQRYCEGGVPASFLSRLKLWGGYQQQAVVQVESSPLLRLSASALRDIQADEELGALLDAEIPLESRLVRVALDALERMLELLRERGFTVEEEISRAEGDR